MQVHWQTVGWACNVIAGMLARSDGHNVLYLPASDAARRGGAGMV